MKIRNCIFNATIKDGELVIGEMVDPQELSEEELPNGMRDDMMKAAKYVGDLNMKKVIIASKLHKEGESFKTTIKILV
jgi:hypothetical protein